MPSPQLIAPRWLVVHLGEDHNWWIDQTAAELDATPGARSVLDPRQVAHLVQALAIYEAYGLTRAQAAAAFQLYAIDSELADDRLRLLAVAEPLTAAGEQYFAMPLVAEDGADPYSTFLDALSTARIRLLNATHDYVRACTADDMYAELDAVDANRYFSDEVIHVFDEINEIHSWSPAEWDNSTS